ncbi:APC family permease [Solirubrobacter phytolaccae]|uniref:APC family permease n=1 Tax=Solirubrobacter phytolaccae TaxID=1404360 RepID=A0A9X3SCZ0_9ACTN|nr:APC family permease [Solirubrobacter phytolaccae]MDA0183065.1 APC family permease [Solirubrobacter phytolaccae]
MAVAEPPRADLNPETGEFETPLKRVIGPGMLLVFVVGDVLGAGIYALVGVVAGETGGAIWTAFLFATILAIMTAFSYAELVTKYPAAGGAATYVDTAFKVPLLTFVIAFAVMCSGIASAATLSKAFAGDYLSEFVELPVVLVAIGFLLIVALINFRGISESIKLNMVLTGIEVLGLVIIVVIGVAALANGDGDAGRNLDFPAGENVALAIVGGAALSFYALIGFEDAVNVAEETKDPARNFPKALFGGLLIAGVIYLLVTFTASMVVPTQQLTDSDGPLLEVVREGPLGVPTKLFAGIALLAVANGALINMIMASRLVYGMSVRGVVPRIFDRVHSGRHTPIAAIIFTTGLAMLLASLGDLSDLAGTTTTLLLFVFAIVNVAVLVLRPDPGAHPHFQAPSVIPVASVVIIVFLLIRRASDNPEYFAYAGALVALGIVLWAVQRVASSR